MLKIFLLFHLSQFASLIVFTVLRYAHFHCWILLFQHPFCSQVSNCCYTWRQVLLATGGGHLVYLEIGDGILQEVKHAQLEYEISCLDINPIGENPNQSQLAAVGMWTDISVRLFSLPELNLITKEHLGGEIIPRSVLLCAFEGVCFP